MDQLTGKSGYTPSVSFDDPHAVQTRPAFGSVPEGFGKSWVTDAELGGDLGAGEHVPVVLFDVVVDPWGWARL